jgi:hypothetical protein
MTHQEALEYRNKLDKVMRETGTGHFTEPQSGALRFDEGKPQFHLLHPALLIHLYPSMADDPVVKWFFFRTPCEVPRLLRTQDAVRVLEKGSEKYGPYNYSLGMSYSRVFNSYLRHQYTNLHYGLEKLDAETGLPHQSHAMCNALFAILYGLLGYDGGKWDDRPTGLSYDDSWRLTSPFKSPRI